MLAHRALTNAENSACVLSHRIRGAVCHDQTCRACTNLRDELLCSELGEFSRMYKRLHSGRTAPASDGILTFRIGFSRVHLCLIPYLKKVESAWRSWRIVMSRTLCCPGRFSEEVIYVTTSVPPSRAYAPLTIGVESVGHLDRALSADLSMRLTV